MGWSALQSPARWFAVGVVACACACALAGAPASAGAQRVDLRSKPAPGFAAIVGVVDDSLRGGPLVGATVAVIGTSVRTTTDQDGLFRIDSLPPGEVQLAVLHPLLDTLYIVVTTQKFTLVDGRLEEMGIATPPLERIRLRSCPRAGVVLGDGILIGRVDDPDTDRPVPGALVSLVYSDPRSGTPIQRVRSARSRDDGLYAICGLPETLTGTVQAAVGAAASSEIPVTMKAQFLATASFLLSTAPKDSVARGTAALTGRVTDVTGAPIASAQVAVEGGNAIAVTGSDGTFALTGLPSGTTSAVIRKIGYAPALRTVHLRKAAPQRVAVTLSEGVRTLAAVVVTGGMEPALKKVGFTERRNMGMRSQFLLPADIEKRNPSAFTDLFRQMSGFRVTSAGMGQSIEGTRSSGGAMSGCVNVYVDRVAFEQMSPGDLDSAFPIGMIGAVETYASASETPAEFQMPGRSCATIVAWTKMKLAKP